MPRKRTTRAKQPTKPKKADIGVAEDMSVNERKEQLEICLRDFDYQVKTHLKEIEKKKRTVLVFIQMKFEEQAQAIPGEIKDMTLKDFAKAGGTFEMAKACLRTSSLGTQKRLAELQNLRCTGMKSDALETIAEGDSDGAPETVKQTATTAKRKGRQGKATMAPPSTRKSSRTKSQFATPANSLSRPIWGQTPLITPKFDPNLPTTPENVREMKPGERLMSLAGSPVQVGNRRKAIGVPVNKTEIAHEWSDITGVDLTPNRIERMLRLVSGPANAK